MKNILVVIGLLAILVAPSMGTAAFLVDVNRISGYYSGDGGEFSLYSTAISNADYNSALRNLWKTGSFQSFCLETDEFVGPLPGTYKANVSTSAIAGGSGGPSPDPISVGTAWLYSQFAQNVYALSGTRPSNANLFQQAIWYLEDETLPGGGTPSISAYQSMLIAKFGSLAAAKANYNYETEDLGVFVLNLTTLTDGVAQDMLVWTANPEQFVPIPPTVYLLGAGLLGLVGLRRKFKK
jgi:hypothetical protein